MPSSAGVGPRHARILEDIWRIKPILIKHSITHQGQHAGKDVNQCSSIQKCPCLQGSWSACAWSNPLMHSWVGFPNSCTIMSVSSMICPNQAHLCSNVVRATWPRYAVITCRRSSLALSYQPNLLSSARETLPLRNNCSGHRKPDWPMPYSSLQR